MCDFNVENDPRSQIIHMKKIQAEGLELFIKKNADYGNSYKQFGLIGVLVRLQDKINRALHISQHGIHVKDETLRDTLIDLHNYAAMALMESESEPTVPNLPLRHSFEPEVNPFTESAPNHPVIHVYTEPEANPPVIHSFESLIPSSNVNNFEPRRKRYDSIDFKIEI